MAYIPKSDSVVGFQSDASKLKVEATQPAGSVMAVSGSFTAPTNQSVSGALFISGSVLSQQTGTRITSVSGLVDISGSVASAQIGTRRTSISGVVDVAGSVAALVTNFPTTQNVSGSVIAQITSSVLTVTSGTVGASMVGGLYRSNTGFQASVHSGIPQWGVRNEGNIDFSGNDGDYIPIAVNAKGRVFVSEGNHSVSGALFISGSVLSQQTGTVITSVVSSTPSSMLVGASIIGLTPVTAVITGTPSISGAVTIVGSLPVQSVSGTVGASIIGTVPVTQATSEWTVKSSIAGGIFPISGSVAATVTNFPANQSISGQIVVVSSITGGIFPISGSVAATITNNPLNIAGSVIAQISSSVLTVISGNVPTTQLAGSVMAVSGSFTSPANQSVSGTVVATQIAGSVMAVSGSFAPAANQSVSGTVGASLIGVAIEGTAEDGEATMATGALSVEAYPMVFNGTSWDRVRAGSTTGAIRVAQADTVITSVISSNPSSMLVGASIIGLTPVNVTNTSLNVGGSVIAQVASSVLVTMISRPSISGAVFVSGSVLAQQTGTLITSVVSSTPSSMLVGASIIGLTPISRAAQSGTVITSISGVAYAEDTAHTSGDIGIFSLRIRNDTMSSITSADGDYSPDSVGPTGETIVANSPITKWVQGKASVLNTFGTQEPIIAAQGASIFTYITGVQIANMSANTALVGLMGAGSSLIGYTVAPAGGGSNIVFPNALKTNANGAFSASVGAVSSIFISAQGFISKT